jgi:hypothetical protein
MKSKFLLRVIFLLIFYVNSILTRLNLRQATSFPEFHRQNPPQKQDPFFRPATRTIELRKARAGDSPNPEILAELPSKSESTPPLGHGRRQSPRRPNKSQERREPARLMRGKIYARRIWSDKESTDGPDVRNWSTGGSLYRRRRCRYRAGEGCTRGEPIASVAGCFPAPEYLLRGVKRNNSSWLVV